MVATPKERKSGGGGVCRSRVEERKGKDKGRKKGREGEGGRSKVSVEEAMDVGG